MISIYILTLGVIPWYYYSGIQFMAMLSIAKIAACSNSAMQQCVMAPL